MLFGLLLSILTATYSLTSTTTVESSGEVPANATYYYARTATTGQKGQMTAGNSTCLSLAGWDGSTIHSLALQMRSNKTSGTGSLSVRIGNEVVWSIANQPFEHESWHGSYTTDWVYIQRDIFHQVQPGDTIEIVISATENSLYIASYNILYEPAELYPYTIDFKTGLDTVPTSLHQTEVGAQVVLPHWLDTAGWYFIGWSEQDIENTYQAPNILPAGSIYFPNKDMCLWAVYVDNIGTLANLEYITGEYAIGRITAFTESISGEDMGMVMNGNVEHSEVQLASMHMPLGVNNVPYITQEIRTDMIYALTFLSDHELEIQHMKTGTYVGYTKNQLSSERSIWQYRILEDNSLAIYYIYQEKAYALYFGFGVQGTTEYAIAYAQHISIDDWHKNGMWLFAAEMTEYTSWPLGRGDDLENIFTPHHSSNNFTWYIGGYKLHILNGKKYLRILQ